MNGSRNQTLDIIKGFAIFLVVFGHSIQFNTIDNFDSNIIFRVIYSFHMPLFMFISGFISYKTFDGSITKLVKRFKALIIPFWVWFVFTFIFTYSLFSYSGNEAPNFFNSIIHILKHPDAGLWFLWVLFQNYLILFFSLKISSRKEEIWAGIFLLVIIIISRVTNFNYLGILFLKWHLFFYLFGYTVNKYIDNLRNILKSSGLVSMVLFPILVCFWSRTGNPTFYNSLEFNRTIIWLIMLSYKYLVPITAILAVYTFFDWLIQYKFFLKKTLLKLGEISLEIYSTHFYFFSFIYLIISVSLHYRIIITFTASILGSIIIQYFIKKVKLMSILFYGK